MAIRQYIELYSYPAARPVYFNIFLHGRFLHIQYHNNIKAKTLKNESKE